MLGLGAVGLLYPRALAVDGGYVYWANDQDIGSGGGIQRCAIGVHNQTPELVAPADLPVAVAIDELAVYWTNGALGGGVSRIAK